MRLLYYLQSIRFRRLDQLMVLFTRLGDKGLIWLLVAFPMLFFRRSRPAGLAMLLSLTAALILGNGLLKPLGRRDRPCWKDDSVSLLIPLPNDYSFPSCHTYASFAASVSLLPFAHPVLTAAAVALAAVIGFSRLYLFVHYLSDVVIGGILGALTGMSVVYWMPR